MYPLSSPPCHSRCLINSPRSVSARVQVQKIQISLTCLKIGSHTGKNRRFAYQIRPNPAWGEAAGRREGMRSVGARTR